MLSALLSTVAVAVPPPQSPPAQVVPPPAVAEAGWRDRAPTPGDWRYEPGAVSVARFGSAGAPRLSISCDFAQRAVALSVPGGAGAMTVRTAALTRALTAGSGGAVRLDPRDPLLDAMGYSRGRIAVEQGAVALIVPAWPEILRVVEDCRG